MPTASQLEAILKYAKRVNTLPSEAARVAEFAGLLREVFGDTPTATDDFTGSMESRVTYTSVKNGARLVRYGRLDAMVGNTIIEFKQKLKDGRGAGLEELRKYAFGLSEKLGQDSIPFEGILTDGLTLERYELAVSNGKKFALANLESTLLESFELKPNDRSAEDFYFFICRNLLSERSLDPTPTSFARIFGRHGRVYALAKRRLTETWAKVREGSDVRLARSQWAHFLQFATETPPDGEPIAQDAGKGDDLYLTHTYLACLSRFMIWAAFGTPEAEQESENIIEEVLTGAVMKRLRVMDLADRDTFHWVLKPDVEGELIPLWRQTLEELRAFRLKGLKADILKVLYEELVDPVDRHELGEYYTPDWLCREVVEASIPEFGSATPRVLDPSCGSGSFLVAVINYLKNRLVDGNAAPELIAQEICGAVVGFDIHPLACMVARTNYMLALGEYLPLAELPLTLPVYLADSMAGGHVDNRPRLMDTEGIKLSIGVPPLEEVVVPPFLANSQDFDYFIAVVLECAQEDIEGHPYSEPTVAKIYTRHFRILADKGRQADLRECVTATMKLARQMADLSREGRDTIWGWIAKNFYRPELFRRHFDLVVGNPPWLSFRYVGNLKYKQKLEKFALDRYGVASEKSSLRTQTEVATTFFVHSVNWFLKDKHSRAAMVLPRAVFSSDQHAKFREGPTGPDAKEFSITGIWDIADVQPVFNVPSCVIFAQRQGGIIKPGKPIPGEVFAGRLPQREPELAEARERIKRKKVKWGLARLGAVNKPDGKGSPISGGRTAWVADPKPYQGVGQSPYGELFANGASIYPRNGYFVRLFAPMPAGKDVPVAIKTCPEQQKTAKAPWKELVFSGFVERRFMFKSAIAKDLLPFLVGPDLPDVALPLLIEEDGTMKLLTSTEIKHQGFMQAHKYFAKFEAAWKKHRKGAASQRTETLLERLDFSRGLTGQRLSSRWVVMYATSGMHVVAGVLDRESLDCCFFGDITTVMYSCSMKAEAYYLSAVLNSDVPNQIIKPFQARGLLGERHIHKKILDVAFPKFNPKNPVHVELAALGEKCAKLASKAIATLPGTTLGARRTAMRKVLKDELHQIDDLVKQLLGL